MLWDIVKGEPWKGIPRMPHPHLEHVEKAGSQLQHILPGQHLNRNAIQITQPMHINRAHGQSGNDE